MGGQRLRYPVAFLLALVLAGCGPDAETRKQRHLERGAAYLEQGKVNEAIIELKNSLQIDSSFVPALHVLGLAYAAKFWYADAARELQRAVDAQPAERRFRVDLANVFLESEAWDAALANGQAVLEGDAEDVAGLVIMSRALLGKRRVQEAYGTLARIAPPGRNDPAVLEASADVLRELGRMGEAERAYRQVLQQKPHSIEALLGLAEMLGQRNMREQAVALLAQAKSAEPSRPRVRLAIAAQLAAQDRMAEAVRELEELPRSAWSGRVTLAAGEFYVRAGRFEDAVSVLQPLVQHAGNLSVARYFLGHALLGVNRPEHAVAEFQEVVRLAPDNAMSRFGLAHAYLRSGRAREALVELTAVAKPLERLPDFHMQLGRTHLALAQYPEAIRAADAALRSSPQTPQPYALLGAIYMRRGDLRRAQEMYSRAVAVDPNFTGGYVALGHVYSLEQKPEEALRAYDAALAADVGNTPAIGAKAAALVRQQRLDDAIALVRGALQRDAANPRLIALLGNLHWLGKDARQAEQQYRRALTLDDGFTPARFGLAQLAAATHRETEAITLLQRVLKDRPGHAPAAAILAGLHARQADFDPAIAVLETAIKRGTETVDLKLYLANLYVMRGRFNDVLDLLLPVLQSNPGMVQARMLAGLAHLGKHAAAPAIEQFEQVNRLNPKIALNHYYLGRALLARGDIEGAKKAYQEALVINPGLKEVGMELAALTGDKPDEELLAARIAELKVALARDPTNISIRNAVARAHLARGDVREAEAEMKRILEVAPTFSPANLAMALIRLRDKKPDEAAGYLNAVVRTNPGDAQARVLLAQYYAAKGNREQAIEHLEHVYRMSPSLQAPKLMLARLYGQTGRPAEGLPRAREVIAANPEAAAGHLAVGELLLRLGQWRNALESFTTAVRLQPDQTEGHLGLGSAHERLGEQEQALAAYRRAQALSPKSPTAYNNIAWIYAMQGRNLNDAVALARRAQQLAPDTPAVLDTVGFVHYRRGEYDKAEPLLRRASELAPRNATIQYHLGMTLYRLGRAEAAAVALQRSLQLDDRLPEASEVRAALAQLRR